MPKMLGVFGGITTATKLIINPKLLITYKRIPHFRIENGCWMISQNFIHLYIFYNARHYTSHWLVRNGKRMELRACMQNIFDTFKEIIGIPSC